MKRIILLAIILNISLNVFSQKIISAENPLEETLQNDFDSSILYSNSNQGYYHNYLIISKKDSLVYFYRYSSPLNSYINFRMNRMTRETREEIIYIITDMQSRLRNMLHITRNY